MRKIVKFRFKRKQPILGKESKKEEDEWNGFIEWAIKIKDKLNKKKRKTGVENIDGKNSEVDPNEFNNSFEFFNETEEQMTCEIIQDVKQLNHWMQLKENQNDCYRKHPMESSENSSDSSNEGNERRINQYNSIYRNVYSNLTNCKKQKKVIKDEASKKRSGEHFDKNSDLIRQQKNEKKKTNIFQERKEGAEEVTHHKIKMNAIGEDRSIHNELLSGDLSFENDRNKVKWSNKINKMNKTKPMKLEMDTQSEDFELTYSLSEDQDQDSQNNISDKFEYDKEMILPNNEIQETLQWNQRNPLSSIPNVKKKEMSTCNDMLLPELNFHFLDQYMNSSNVSDKKINAEEIVTEHKQHKKNNELNEIGNMQNKKNVSNEKKCEKKKHPFFNDYNHKNELFFSHSKKNSATDANIVSSDIYSEQDLNQLSLLNYKKPSINKALVEFQNNEFKIPKVPKKYKKKENVPKGNIDGTYSFNYVDHSSNESEKSSILKKSFLAKKEMNPSSQSLLMNLENEMNNYKFQNIF